MDARGMDNPPTFEGKLRIRWTGHEQAPSVRVEQFLVQGPREGRYRLLLGQLIEPVILSEEDLARLQEQGTIDCRVVAAVEFTEESGRKLLSLLERHFRRHGTMEMEEKDEHDGTD